MSKLTNMGGKRKGAGRPKQEPTAPLNIRVPVKHKPRIVAMVKAELIRLKELDKKP